MDGNFEENFWEKFKLPIALSLVGIVLIVGGIFASNLTKSKPKDYPKESLVTQDKMISVDVSGAVNKPGVYKLKDGSRIEDVIKAAGGFAENSNQEYISKSLNLAQKLSDGSKVYVPAVGEQTSVGAVSGVMGTSSQVKVNINTASQSDLEALQVLLLSELQALFQEDLTRR